MCEEKDILFSNKIPRFLIELTINSNSRVPLMIFNQSFNSRIAHQLSIPKVVSCMIN